MINYTRTQKIGAFIAVPGVIAFFAGFFCDDNGFMTSAALWPQLEAVSTVRNGLINMNK